MSERIEFEEQENGNVVVTSVRKVYLASWGAASYTTDFGKSQFGNINELSGKLVGKGEEVEQNTRDTVTTTVSSTVSNQQKALRIRSKKLEKAANKRFEGILHAVNIPTRSDINKLNKKVARLSKQLDTLATTQEA